VSLQDYVLQLGFVMIAAGSAMAVLALFPDIGPWRRELPVEPEAPVEPPEKVTESRARRKAARPRKKAASSSRKAAR
jgi:hypothetical protein